MERVIVGFDGSPAAESALDWVTDRANRHPVLLDIVAVANMFSADRGEAAERLEDAEARLRARLPGGPVESHLLDGAMPATLVNAARGDDLLVVGIDRGRHPVRTALRGWMPLRVAVHAQRATCIVPRGWSPSDGPVFVGVDEDSSDRALLFAADEAAETRSHLRVVHAWSEEGPKRAESSAVLTAMHVHAEHGLLLREAAQRARAAHRGLRVETDLIYEDDPANVLRSLAAEGSLVVLGTHGRGLLAGAIAKSVAQNLVWDLASPVCIIPDEERSSE